LPTAVIELLTAIGALSPFDFAIEDGQRQLLSRLVTLAGVSLDHFRSDVPE
jgi:hypothetical protein